MVMRWRGLPALLLVWSGCIGTDFIDDFPDDGGDGTPMEEVTGDERTGEFTARAGTSYQVMGTVTLKRLDSGRLSVEFADNFSTSNGPRLHVYLSESQRVTGSSVDLGALQSTTGAQAYTVSSEVTLEQFNYVLIHCVPFNVSFGFAQLGG